MTAPTMTDRRLAIIIVSYRSARLTMDCLQSIADQLSGVDAGTTVSCVVVDNASGDGPPVSEFVRERGWGHWATVLVAERNGGFAYGNNVGLLEASRNGRPDFVHLLNPDTVLHPGALNALLRFFDRTPRAGIAGGIFENGDGSEWAIAFRFPSALSEIEHGMQLGIVTRLLSRWRVPIDMGREPAAVDWISGASMMIRGDVFARIGTMNESFFLYFEETEFCFRAKRAGFEVWYVPESRVTHIAGQSTKVTERNVATRRLPSYWFDSRRLYFTLTRGAPYAALADVVALIAGFFGNVKRAARRRSAEGVPHFLRDIFAHSIFASPRRTPASVPEPTAVDSAQS
jgi:N-acetylglucosaminyl-diphospho-decaprenol L-rhamnosyltransferase